MSLGIARIFIFIYVFICGCECSLKLISNSSTLNPDLLVGTEHGLVYGTYRPPYHSKPAVLSEQPSSKFWHRAFMGIPFAKPPVGHLRFRDAQPFERYSDIHTKSRSSLPNGEILLAHQYGNACMQYSDLFRHKSEDCLFLNVFTPHVSRLRSADRDRKLLPVVFFIFGGAMFFGDSYFDNWYDPRRIISKNDVIYVSFNYRLSIFGFLNGAYAYSDVKRALEWTKNNIKQFGGDPDRITLMGMSSGSQFISYLTVDTEAPEFERAILLSPPLILKPRSHESSMKMLKRYADLNQCTPSSVGPMFKNWVSAWIYGRRNNHWSGSDSLGNMPSPVVDDIIKCLRGKSALSVLSSTMFTWRGLFKSSQSGTPLSDTMYWAPPESLGPHFNPLQLLSQTSANEMSMKLKRRLQNIKGMMFGVSKDEASMFIDPVTLGDRLPNLPFLAMKSPQMKKNYIFKAGLNGIWSRIKSLFGYAKGNGNGFHKELYVDTLNSLFNRLGREEDMEFINRLLEIYPVRSNKLDNLKQTIKILSLYAFHCPIRNFAESVIRIQSQTSKNTADIHMYEMRHVVDYLMPLYGPNSKWINVTRVAHASDIPLFFNSQNPQLKSRGDVIVSDFLIEQLMHFTAGRQLTTRAYTNATLASEDAAYHILKSISERETEVTFKWTKYTEQQKAWLLIGPQDRLEVRHDLYSRTCDLFDSIGYRY